MQMGKALWLISFVVWSCVELSLQTARPEHYAILGITPQATPQEIKKAFRKQAAKYHPDKNKKPGAEEVFKAINEAHEAILDQEKMSQDDIYEHVRSTRSSSSSHTSETGGFTFHFNSNYDNFFGHEFNPKTPPFGFNQREFHSRPNREHHQSFFSFDDFFENDELRSPREFFRGDPHEFGSGSSFFGSHFGGGYDEPNYEYAEPVNYEFYPPHDKESWSNTRCQIEKKHEGNVITTTVRCS